MVQWCHGGGSERTEVFCGGELCVGGVCLVELWKWKEDECVSMVVGNIVGGGFWSLV